MSTIEQNKAAVREFTKVFKNEHNVDVVDRLFAPNFRHNFKMQVAPGLAGFKAIGRMMNAAFPDVVVTEEDLIANDNTVVERSAASATHRGELMGAPPTGKKCQWTEIHIYRFDDAGKIVEHWVEWSTFELLTQLGIVKM
jgi:predicted ester cyclase